MVMHVQKCTDRMSVQTRSHIRRRGLEVDGELKERISGKAGWQCNDWMEMHAKVSILKMMVGGGVAIDPGIDPGPYFKQCTEAEAEQRRTKS